MAKGVWQATIINEQTQKVVPFASVVFRDIDDSLITLYADADGTASPGNPKTADAQGFIRVYFDPNVRVNITASHSGFSRLYKDVISIVESGDSNVLDAVQKFDESIYNLTLLVVQDGDDLDVSIRTKSGEVPSSSDPAVVPFKAAPDQTPEGSFVSRIIDSALSVTIPSGASFCGGNNEAPEFEVYIFLAQDAAGGVVIMASASPFWDENTAYTFAQISSSSDSPTAGYSSTAITNATVRLIGKFVGAWDDGFNLTSFETITKNTAKPQEIESEIFQEYFSTCAAGSNNLVYTLQNAAQQTPSANFPVRVRFPFTETDEQDLRFPINGNRFVDFISASTITIPGGASLGQPNSGTVRLFFYATLDEESYSKGVAVSATPHDESKQHTIRTIDTSSDSASELYGTSTGTRCIKLLDVIDVQYGTGNWTNQPSRRSKPELVPFTARAVVDTRPRIVWGLVPSVGALNPNQTAESITISPGAYWDGTKLWTLAAPITKKIDAVFSAGTGNGGVFALGEWGTGSGEISKVVNAHLITNNTTGLLDVVLNRVYDSSRTTTGYTWLCRLCSIPTEEVYYDSSSTLSGLELPAFYCLQLRDGTLEIQLGWDGIDHNHLIRSHTNPGTAELAFNNSNLLPQNPTLSITHELLVWAKDSTASSQTIVEVYSRLTDRRGGADYEVDQKRSGFPDIILGAAGGGFSQGQVKLLLTPQYDNNVEGLAYRLSQSTVDHQIAIYSNRFWDRRLVQ